MLNKAGFGLAEIGVSAIELMLQVYLLELYLRAGLDPFWAGLALAIAVVWDAVSDPVMGVISDRTPASSALGKRAPYFLAGTALMAVAFYQLYSPSGNASQGELFGYLLLWYLILNTAMTLLGVPHLAMANDMSGASGERTELFGWRLGFGGVGLLLGLSIPVLVAGSEELDKASFLSNRSNSAAIMSAIALVTCASTAAMVWKALKERKSDAGKAPTLFWNEIKSALDSRPFRMIAFGFIFISLGRALNASLALLYYKISLQLDERVVAGLLLVFTGVIIVAAPIWILLSRRWSKRSLCVQGIAALAAITAVVYPIVPEETLWPVMTVAVMGGFLVACIALLESLISDVVEEDRHGTDMDLAGAYFGVWRMGIKVARALGILVSSWFLAAIGFEEGNVEQTEFVREAIAWGFGPGVALFFGGGAFFIAKARLKRETGY